MYYGLTEFPEKYNDKVSLFVALGPVVRLDHAPSDIFNFFAENRDLVVGTCNTLGIKSLFEANCFTTGTTRLLCGTIP